MTIAIEIGIGVEIAIAIGIEIETTLATGYRVFLDAVASSA